MRYKIEYYKEITVLNHFTFENDTINQHFINEFTTEQEAIDFKTTNNITSNIETFEEVIIVNYELRITSLLLGQYKFLHNSKIDFRKHLDENIQLNKDVIMVNGRPDYAIYTYDNINIARIRFVFEFDSIGFVSKRQEILGYYNTNDEIETEYVISEENFTNNSTYHLLKKMNESKQVRENVIDEIKTTVNGFLIQYYMPLGQTLSQIQTMASHLFSTYNDDINVWKEVGESDLSVNLTNDTLYEWLDLEIAPSVTVREYIVSKID
jgi:hypothetical protein